MSHESRIGIVPMRFADAVHDLMGFVWDPRIDVCDMEPPTRLATHAAAIDADILQADDQIGRGRLILLHEPTGSPVWEGDFRCVTFARACVAPEMILDELLPEIGWQWLTSALDDHGAAYLGASGTVTIMASTSFGGIEDRAATSELEIRASWTPQLDPDHPFTAHIEAWQKLLLNVAGLPALGVATIHRLARLTP